MNSATPTHAKTGHDAAIDFLKAIAGSHLDAVKADIEAAAEKQCPKEACGFIIARKKKIEVMHCENRSAEPEDFFRIENYDEAEKRGVIKAVWHSHPYRRPDPSVADKVMSESCGHPIFIVGFPTREWSFYKPDGWKPPLLGRPFVHGVLDCFSLIRDYHKEKLDIEFPDFDRPDSWWLPLKKKPDGTIVRTSEPGEIVAPPANIYAENFAKAGFRRVEDLKTNTCIAIQLRSDVWNHAALYIGDNMILHHVVGRTSCEQPYVIGEGYYGKHTVGFYRHKSLK
jgi:proteasome lid subunit RPN8/RPN11